MNTLSPGTPLQGGKYRIEETLAQNASCITYLATWVDYGIRVCIKEFFMKGICQRQAGSTRVVLLADAADHQRSFLREARTVARLDHPNIVRIHDRFEENGTAYYVMEFVEGPSLADIVRQHGKMAPEQARSDVRLVGEALDYMHGQGVTHGAVRPAHIIVRSRDRMPILIDFRKAGERGEEGSAADVYALAETLEELLTGEIPAMLRDVPSDVMEFLRASGCIKPAIEETRVKSVEGAGTASSAAAAKPQGGAVEVRSSGQVGVARTYVPAGSKPQRAAGAPVKTEAERQKERYNEVSRQFTRNMASNNRNPNDGAGFGVVIIIVIALLIVGYYLIR